MENRRGTMIKVVMACLMVVAVAKGATAAEYVVGDSLGWTLPPNTSFYSDWAASKTFQIGDSLFFNWTGNHNLADLVAKETYDNCTDNGTVLTYGPGVQPILSSNGSRFFICTVGNNCEKGQKVTITVGSPTNISALFPPSGASSLTATSLGFGLISTLVLSLITM